MARFSIRDLLLITAIVALATGWLVERRQLDFSRTSAESESAKQEAERAKYEALWKKGDRELQQLVNAVGEHGVQVYFRNGQTIVSPDAAFTDDPLKVEVPGSVAGSDPMPHTRQQ